MASIYENLKNDRQYSASTGLNKEKFEELFIEFNTHYKPRNNNAATGEKPLFTDSRQALFFILFYLKTYPTLQVLGLQFNMSDFAASTYIKHILPFLKITLAAKSALSQRIFKDEQEFIKAFEGVADIMIDCTEIPIERSDNEMIQKKGFSGKKKIPYPYFPAD